MGAFDGILQNKMIQNVFLGQFKRIIKEENLKSILIKVGENGEMETEVFKDDVVVIPTKEYQQLIESLKSQL